MVMRLKPVSYTHLDRSLAARALKEYGNLRMDQDVMRCKLYAILLPAYAILGMEEEAAKLVGVMQTMLPLVKAEQSRALAYYVFCDE